MLEASMPAFNDLTGQRFTRLVVIKRLPNLISPKGSKVIWDCLCDCGKVHTASSRDLTSGDTKSCGCLKREKAAVEAKKMGDTFGGSNKLPEGVAAFNHLYQKYNRNAVRRGYVFNLTKENFRRITSSNCYYCGEAPRRREGRKHSNGSYDFNGIDRKNNEEGYIDSNCVPCCWHCNHMKGMLSESEFIEKIKSILHNVARQ